MLNQDVFVEFFKLSFDPMCIIQKDGQIHLANQAFEKLSEQHDSDSHILTLMHPEDERLFSEAIKKAQQDNMTQSVAARLKESQGSYRWFLWKIQPSKQDFLYLLAKDITPFQQLESVEQARSQFAEALLDTILTVNNSNLSLDTVLHRILANMIKVVDFNHVDILLNDKDTAYFAAMQNRGEAMRFGSGVSDFNYDVDDFYYLKLMETTKRPIIVPDISLDPHWTSIAEFDSHGSCLACPVIYDNNVIAFITVISMEKNYYTSIHAHQLLMFANHVAIAINNTYLFEQAEIAAALKERQRLARELHDSVNQLLFSAGTYVNLIPKVIDKAPEKVLEYGEKAGQRIRGALAQLRTILIELHPESLVNTELDTLLKQLSNAFHANTGITINLTASKKLLLPADAQIAYYRIAQESLNNIEKHAKAMDVRINLSNKNGQISLIIEDDGAGFNAEELFISNYGLKIMHQRAQTIGANLTVESQIGKGTRIMLKGKFDVNK